VPVVHVRHSEDRLGGAASVAHCCAALGGRVELFGAAGDDDAGRRLLDAVSAAGIGLSGLQRLPGRQTAHKVLVRSQGQQIVRLDHERSGPLGLHGVEAALECARRLEPPEAILLCDHARGFLTDGMLAAILDLGRRLGVPVAVDPGRPDFGAYAGATVVSPTLRALEVASGDRLAAGDEGAIVAAARRTLHACPGAHLVVTLGERGLLVVPPGGPPSAIRSVRREVSGVTGAGKTVLAVLGLGLAAGLELAAAARLASAAAGVAVTRAGTAVVRPDEISAALGGRGPGKIHSRESIVRRAVLWREEGRRVVLTNGCFDLMHAGHLHLLREAAGQGDALVVAINSDRSVARLKGPERPLVPEAERAAMLAAMECVDAVVAFDEETPAALIEEIAPDVLVKGGDYALDQIVGRDFVEGRGGNVIVVPLVPERSTSTLVQRILDRHRA